MLVRQFTVTLHARAYGRAEQVKESQNFRKLMHLMPKAQVQRRVISGTVRLEGRFQSEFDAGMFAGAASALGYTDKQIVPETGSPVQLPDMLPLADGVG